MLHFRSDIAHDILLFLSSVLPLYLNKRVWDLVNINRGDISESYVLSLSGALVNTLWTKPVRLAICFSIASIRSRR